MALPWWLPFGSVPDVDALDLLARLSAADPPQLLDVRTAAEFASAHIQGAINVPIARLKGQVADLPMDRHRPVVAICLHAVRSKPAVRLLRRAGYVDVRELRGGMKGWRAAGLPVITSD